MTVPGKTNETMRGALTGGQEKCALTPVMLWLRNAMVALAATFFLASLPMFGHLSMRAAGYLFGALAYVCEIFVLTDCFRVKLPSNEMFMPYCFGPLYAVMGIGYLIC